MTIDLAPIVGLNSRNAILTIQLYGVLLKTLEKSHMPTKKTRHVRLQTDRHVLERYYEDTYSNYPYYQCHNCHNWDW
ncbi:MAG: hypothetical protein WCF23_24150 [Candidatus Nitrosopolaris sp.]